MASLPLISIALASYNGARYLEQQIDSLLSQDYPNLEIVISDDYSSDDTWIILKKLAKLDKRIRLLPRIGNLGYVKNFYRIFLACNGKYISPCDQDDIWYHNKTSRLYEFKKNNCLIYCNSRLVDSNGHPLGYTMSDNLKMIEGNNPKQLLFSNSISGHSMLFDKSILNRPGRITDCVYIDWHIAFLSANFGTIRYLDEVLVDYRQNSNSVVSIAKNKPTYLKRLSSLKHDARRLEIFSEYPGSDQSYCLRLKKYWNNWHKSLFSPTMFFFIFCNISTTHYAFTNNFSSIRKILCKYIVGNKLKNILFPNNYPAI